MIFIKLFLLFSCIAWSKAQTASDIAISADSCNLRNPFVCASGECIPRESFCDLKDDCRDGSDEIIYNPDIHSNEGIECFFADFNTGNLRPCFLPNKYVCDRVFDCTFGEDESYCNSSMRCDISPFPYRDEHWIARSQFCDRVRNCVDESDERKYSPDAEGYQCAVTKLRTKSYCMLPTRNTCDGIPDCDDSTDECFCDETGENVEQKTYWNDRCFRCFDRSLVLPNRQLCDNTFHCQDLSDECLCENKPAICDQLCKVGQSCDSCDVGQVLCQKNETNATDICINRTRVCDRTYDCPLHEDEANCDNDFSQIFNCSNGQSYIPKHQRCDNYQDCDDNSDEEQCEERFLVCNSSYPSPYGSGREGAYDFARPRYAVPCDKIPTCEDLEDECNVSLCGSSVPRYCAYTDGKDGFICPGSNTRLIGTEVCDGYPSCSETSPHSSVDELFCSGRFYCDDRGAESLPIHIPMSAKCNNISDCFDESDELGCSNSTHFYCDSGSPKFVPRSKVCNGIQDCYRGEDECQNCYENPFSSDFFLISSYVLQVFIWIIGLFAVFGNVGVLIHNGRQLMINRQNLSTVAYNHRILVINLAVADLLLGIYLMGLGIVNSVNEEIYCQQDIQWRSSSSCLAIGALAVISVECSVFLLAIMATMRVFLVTKPLTSKMQRIYIMVGVTCAWIGALLLAFVPLSESQEDYFVSELWYQNNPFLTLVNRGKLEEFTTSVQTLQNREDGFVSNATDVSKLTWHGMIEKLTGVSNRFEPNLSFGYYSAHGVCLPRIFPDPAADRSWGFSLFLITLNFLVFVYMLCAYVLIYRITINHGRQAGVSADEESSFNLQRKISRIIFSNFCCWIPICIMAFISAGGGYVSADAYAISAIVLLPINSAFNPLLYSDLPELIWDKFCANTSCGRWVESKHLARVESRREKSRSAGSVSTAKHFETTITTVAMTKHYRPSIDERCET